VAFSKTAQVSNGSGGDTQSPPFLFFDPDVGSQGLSSRTFYHGIAVPFQRRALPCLDL